MSIEAFSATPPAPERASKPDVVYVEQYNLRANEPASLSSDHYSSSSAQIYEKTGIRASVICDISAAGKEFAVLDTRDDPTVNVPALLVEAEFFLPSDRTLQGYKGLRDNEHVIVGRHHLADRFDYPDTVSRKHFSLRFDEGEGQLYITDLRSSGGTTVSGYLTSEEERKNYIWSEYTEDVNILLARSLARNYGERSQEAPYGYYRNHPIIGRNSKSVRNGVYGSASSEMVLVDDKSRAVQRVTSDFINSVGGGRFNMFAATRGVRSVLTTARHHAAEVLRYDLAKVDTISSPYYGNNGLIDLSAYIESGVGVCRHQALLAAHLIEEAIEQKLISGSVGVERNHDFEANGAHAWTVYRSADGKEEIIVDPAQNFVGTRQEAERVGRWKYKMAQ